MHRTPPFILSPVSRRDRLHVNSQVYSTSDVTMYTLNCRLSESEFVDPVLRWRTAAHFSQYRWYWEQSCCFGRQKHVSFKAHWLSNGPASLLFAVCNQTPPPCETVPASSSRLCALNVVKLLIHSLLLKTDLRDVACVSMATVTY